MSIPKCALGRVFGSVSQPPLNTVSDGTSDGRANSRLETPMTFIFSCTPVTFFALSLDRSVIYVKVSLYFKWLSVLKYIYYSEEIIHLPLFSLALQ